MQSDSKVGIDPEVDQPRQTSIAEVWPGEFELEVETGTMGVATTTVHRLEMTQLRLLSDQIEDVLGETR